MSTSSEATGELAAYLIALEEERCRAIGEGDSAALAPLLEDELAFTHINGFTEGKDTLVARRAGGPQYAMESKDLRVRVYSDVVAVITGRKVFRIPDTEPFGAAVSEVWVKRAASWQMTIWHGMRVPG